MRQNDLWGIVALAGLSFGLSIPAKANTITITPGTFSLADGENTSFASGTFPVNWTATGNAGFHTGSVLNVNLQPTGVETTYAFVDPGGSITETLADATYYGFYWGSPDLYNTVTFTDLNNVQTVYGDGGTPVPGLVLDQTTAQYVNFYDSGAPWVAVSFTSSGIAFEFDNVSSTTPEPATIVLLAGGFVAIGLGAIRRRRIG